MGTGKKMMIYPWLTVYNTTHLGDIVYDENPTEDDKQSITLSGIENQETICIKKDLTTKLSDEAKDIIRLILNGPAEIIETFMTTKYKKISKNLIKNHLIELGWATKKIDKTFSELKTFVTDLDET